MLTFQVHEQKACFLHICIVLTLFKSRTYSFKCTNLVCLCVDLFIPRILFFSTQLKIEFSFFLSFSLFSLLRQLIAFHIIGIDFSMLILYIKTLMNMFISHTSFLKVSLGFSIYTTISSMEINSFFYDLHSCFLFHFIFITTLARHLITNNTKYLGNLHCLITTPQNNPT